MRDMKSHAEQALTIFRKRVSTNFGFDMLSCLRFLDPTIDQKTAFTQLQREGLVNKVLKYSRAMFSRCGSAVNDLDVIKEVGEFIGRSGVLAINLDLPHPQI